MIALSTTPRKELFNLLDQIIQEEKSYRLNSQKMRNDDMQLEQEHRLVCNKIGDEGGHKRLRMAHEAMFKVHRKIKKEHELIIRRCYTIIGQLKYDLYSEAEIIQMIDNLKLHFSNIKIEHKKMEAERKKILQDHNTFVKTLSGKKFNT